MSFLKWLYALSIAVLLFAFVVFATAAFPMPQAPDVSPQLQSVGQYPTQDQQDLLSQQSQQQQDFQDQLSVYTGVVAFVIIGVAVALLVASILWLGKMVIIGEGVTLGAVFSLLYGLYAAYAMGGGVVSFVAVTVGLMVLLALVYWRFVRSKAALQRNPEQARQPNPKHEQSDLVGIAQRKE